MPKTADIRAVGEFAASRYGVITTKQAVHYGISKDVLNRLQCDGTLVQCRSNVYRFVAHPTSWRQQLYVATVEKRAAASLFSAAALQVVDGWTDAPLVPQILCQHGSRVRVPGAEVHRTRSLASADITTVDGITCTTLARTVIDLRPLVGHSGMMRMLDDLQRRGASMRWVLDRAQLLVTKGRSGPRFVAEEARRRIAGNRVPDSWFERLLADCLQSPLLGGLQQQYELLDAHGNFVARFDLAIPWVRLGIEGHSRGFHVGQMVESYDEDRDMRISKVGWDTQYLGFAATRSPARVRRDMEEVVLRRAADLGVELPSGTMRCAG